MQAARLHQREDLLPYEVELINLDPPAVVEDLNQPPLVEVAEVMGVGDALVQPPNYQQILKNVRLEVSRIVETHFQCPVCLDIFWNSIMLVCQHSFCGVSWACIWKLTRNPRRWKCPICRQIATSLSVDFNARQGRYPACRASPFQQVFDELNVFITQLRE
ncbi:unnamed protein product [Orchesella dallaii]|uniref:RING-type domain-containing protein n=1 Tax=Orchesella dallaii TaxID=48710 RepID=A0ABP1PWW6_9HEXA